MKAIGWILAGGAALYLADKMGYLSGLVGTSTTTGTSTAAAGQPISTDGTPVSTTTNASSNNTTTNVSTTTIAQLQSQLLNAASKDSNFTQVYGTWVGTPYHWMYYVSQLIPNISIDLSSLLPGVDLTQAVSFDVFFGRLKAYLIGQGFSGMGMIARHVNPYTQGPRNVSTKRFGANLSPTGMETYIFTKGAP